MNGEIAQVSKIVAFARKALCTGTVPEFEPNRFVLSLRFVILNGDASGENRAEAGSVIEWLTACKQKGLQDIKLLLQTEVKDRFVLGFSNAAGGLIVCFWENGSVTYFKSAWSFDQNKKGWNVVFTEHVWDDPPKGRPSYTDHTAEFKAVLSDIEGLARNIGAIEFAPFFRKARTALAGGDHGEIPYLPGRAGDIYEACDLADVFGAMGSWNDCPPGMAAEKGLGKEYSELSDRLVWEIRYNLMYAVNESWISAAEQNGSE